jgi:O-glycosyl hydrolase
MYYQNLTTSSGGDNVNRIRQSTIINITVILTLLFAVSSGEVVNVNPSVEHHVFEGWGTSICWWGNIIGGYPERSRDSIMDLIFDTTDGLGLSIIRYNIGGGDNPSHTHMGTGKMMEGFKISENAAYDWTRDANQRWVLNAAKKRIPEEWFIAEAFSNSPPYWMTVSGCASGGAGGSNNLKTEYYTQFADYLTTVVKHFEDAWGISFRTLEPMNEPDIAWTVNGGQEGCSFSHENQARLIREVKNKLDEKNLTTEISAPDGSSYGATIAAYNSYNATVKSCIAQINTHGYFGGSRTDLNTAVRKDGKRLWASEIDGSGAEQPFDQWTHNHNDIVPGLDIANRIIRDLRDLKAHGWVFWQIVESEQAQISLNKNWGCIHADFNGSHNYYITKKFHVLRQFSNFIRPFSRMIKIDNEDAVAFLSPKQDQLIIVQRNATATDVRNEYRLLNFDQVGQSASVWRSSSTENFRKLDDISVSNKTLSALSLARSVTTYILPVVYNKEGDMVLNGDFSQEAENWTFNVWSGAGTGSVKNEEFCIVIENTGASSHDIQLVQRGLLVEYGKTYKIEFDAYASSGRTIEINLQKAVDPWTSYLSQKPVFDLTTERKKFRYVFTMEQTTDTNSQISFNFGASSESVTIDNVSLKLFDPTSISFKNKNEKSLHNKIICNRSNLKISFIAPGNHASLKLYNLNGKLIKSIALKTRPGEIYSQIHSLTNLTGGYYIAIIDSKNQTLYTSTVIGD